MKTTRTGQLAGSTTHAITASAIIAAAPAPHHSVKLSRHLLAGAAVLALLAGASALPAYADGGNAGGSNATQGTGGISDPTGTSPAIDGQDSVAGAGGGGGAGVTDGGKGGDGADGGGGGGGGTGKDIDMSGGGVTNGGPIIGGNGGNGGSSVTGAGVAGGDGSDLSTPGHGGAGGTGHAGGPGGGGGAGGYGAVVTVTTGSSLLTNNSSITGGNGGAGGAAASGFDAGSGGDGGVGLQFNVPSAQMINTGTITGGDGGAGGLATGSPAGADGGPGQGGDGIDAQNLVIQNSGLISGGMGADGVRADAIHLTGGASSLTLLQGSQIIGNVVADGTDNFLQVETDGGNNSSFDVSQIGAIGSSSQFQGFSAFGVTNFNTGLGVGTVTLTGTTTEAIRWAVSTGAVMAISSDSTLGAAGSTIDLDSGGTLRTTADVSLSHNILIVTGTDNAIDTMNHTVTISGQISGSSTWHKIGTGTLTINGDSSTYVGTTDVDAGTLQVGDVNHQGNLSDLGGDIVVNAGGTLSGYGSLGDVNNIDGIVAPGGPGLTDADIGTLNVNSYTPGANSTLRILLTPNGNSNLAISGSAMTHLDGKLNLLFAPGVYAANSRTVLIANSLYDGSFNSVTSNASFATPLDTTDSQTVKVDLGGGTVSNASITIAPTDGHVIGAATSSLVSDTQIANQSLFDHLSDQRQGVEDDALHTAFAGGNPAQLAFAGDMAALNDIVASLPQAIAKNGGWFRALGGFGNIDGSNGAPGIDSYGGGFMAGYDRALTDNLLVGIAAGYTRTAIDDNDHSNATIDTPRVSLYSSYHLGGLAVDGSVGYAFDRIKIQDQSDIGTAKSKHDAHEINAALQASYNINLPNAFALTPHAGVDYLHIFEQGFNEHGAGAFDLNAQSNDTDSLRPQVGVGVSRSFATDNGWHLIPQVDLTYSREVLDNSHNANVTVGGGSFTVDGISPSRDQLALNVDLTAQLNDSVDLSLGYTQVLPVGNTTSYNFTGGVHVLF